MDGRMLPLGAGLDPNHDICVEKGKSPEMRIRMTGAVEAERAPSPPLGRPLLPSTHPASGCEQSSKDNGWSNWS